MSSGHGSARHQPAAARSKSSRFVSKDIKIKERSQAKEIIQNLKRKKKSVRKDNLEDYAVVLEKVVDAMSCISADDLSDTSITVPETIETNDSPFGGGSPRQRRNATCRDLRANSSYDSTSYAEVSDDCELDRLLDQTENDTFRQDYEGDFPDSPTNEFILEQPIDELEISMGLSGYEEGFFPEIARGRCDTIEEVPEGFAPTRAIRNRSQAARFNGSKCACGKVLQRGQQCNCGLVWV